MKSSSCVDESLSLKTNWSPVQRTNTSDTTTEWEIYTTLEENHGKESLHLLWERESLQIKDIDYKNHNKFSLRCLRKDFVPVSVKLKSTIKTRRAKQAMHKAERQLFRIELRQLIAFSGTIHSGLDRWKSRLASLFTPSAIEKCTNFINKVRESRHIKVWDRQTNKFNRLMGKMKIETSPTG